MKHLIRLCALLVIVYAVEAKVIAAQDRLCSDTVCHGYNPYEGVCGNFIAYMFDGNGCGGNQGALNAMEDQCDNGGAGVSCQSGDEYDPIANCIYESTYCRCRGMQCM